MSLNVPLHRVTNVGHVAVHPHPRDRQTERLACHPKQLRGAVRNLADGHRDCRVTVEPIEHHPHVQRHDIAVVERRRGRNTVHARVIARRTQGRRIPLIALERRHGTGLPDLPFCDRIQCLGRHPRCDDPLELCEHRRDQCVGSTHPVQLDRRSAHDHPAAPWDTGLVDDTVASTSSTAAVSAAATAGWL